MDWVGLEGLLQLALSTTRLKAPMISSAKRTVASLWLLRLWLLLLLMSVSVVLDLPPLLLRRCRLSFLAMAAETRLCRLLPFRMMVGVLLEAQRFLGWAAKPLMRSSRDRLEDSGRGLEHLRGVLGMESMPLLVLSLLLLIPPAGSLRVMWLLWLLLFVWRLLELSSK